MGADEAAGVKLMLPYSLLLYAAFWAVRDVLAEFRVTADHAAPGPSSLVTDREFEDFIGYPALRRLAAEHGLA